MKLEGSLDAFSLPDIFQLLSFTKKSGGLHLRRATTRGSVYFRDGAVTGASSDDGRQALARRLVGSAGVGETELSAAVERAANEGIGVSRALLDAGAVDPDFLRSLVAEQVVDAVFDLLRWSEGDFSFTVDEPGPDDVGISLGVEPVVNDARSRLESWDHACRIVPSPETVLALPVGVREDPVLTRGEWALLALVDGRRTVAELVALAGRGDYAVVSALAALIERGLLKVRTQDAGEGALALARRQDILARLENDRVAAAPDEAAEILVAPATIFAPLPPVVLAPDPAEESADDHSGANGVLAEVSFDDASTASTVASVLAAAAAGEPSPFTRSPAPAPSGDVEPAPMQRPAARVDDGVAAHLVADTRVTPARPEPFMPRRRPEFPDDTPRPSITRIGGGGGGAAAAVAGLAVADPTDQKSHIERDPSVNKSLLLRLIAGVRGL
ncbi:MAG TPA: DUF4388 domain-containing protein [Acidothermaceae bacterium]|nr:DUF4388 domain-containing protein [Acidothermaceae bacterium]